MNTERIAALGNTALFGCLKEQELAHIAQHAQEFQFSKGEILFLAGEPAQRLFVVVSGEIRLFQHNAQGREQVIFVATAGTVIGDVPVFDDGPYPTSAASESNVKVLFINKSDVLQFCEKYPLLALNALRLMASRIRSDAQLVEALSLRDVGQRLASFLVNQVQRNGCPAQGRIAFQLQLSNQEIGNRIGSVRDVVSRAFGRLKNAGLIATRGRTVIVPDMTALRLYAASAESPGRFRRRLRRRATGYTAPTRKGKEADASERGR